MEQGMRIKNPENWWEIQKCVECGREPANEKLKLSHVTYVCLMFKSGTFGFRGEGKGETLFFLLNFKRRRKF